MKTRVKLIKPPKTMSDKEICNDFFSNPTKNPRTGKPIKTGGSTYKSLVEKCGRPPMTKEYVFDDDVEEFDIGSEPLPFDEVVDAIKSRDFKKAGEGFGPNLINDRTSDGDTLLHLIAASASYADISKDYVKELIDELGDLVNVQNKRGLTPLYIATQRNNCALVELLLKYGSNPNILTSQGNNALHAAVINSNFQCVKILLDEGRALNIKSKNGQTPLDLAKDELIRDYIEKTFNPKKSPAKIKSPNINNLGIKEVCNLPYIKSKYTTTNVDIPIGPLGYSIIHYAAHDCDNLDILKYIVVNLRANINLQSTKYGDTPLILAIGSGNLAAAEYLLSKGADPNISRPSGANALYDAVVEDNIAAAELLVSHGARLHLSTTVANPLKKGLLKSDAMWNAIKSIVPPGYSDFHETLTKYAASVSKVKPFESPVVPREALAREIYKILITYDCTYPMGKPVLRNRPDIARLSKEIAADCDDTEASPGILLANRGITVGENTFKDDKNKYIPINFNVTSPFAIKFMSFGNKAIAPAVVKLLKMFADTQIIERNGGNYRVINGVKKIGETTGIVNPLYGVRSNKGYRAFIGVSGRITAKEYIRPVDRLQVTNKLVDIGYDDASYVENVTILGEQIPMRMPLIIELVQAKQPRREAAKTTAISSELRDFIKKMYASKGASLSDFEKFEEMCASTNSSSEGGYLSCVLVPWTYTQTAWGKYSIWNLGNVDWKNLRNTPNMFLPNLVVCKKFSYNEFRRYFLRTLEYVMNHVRTTFNPSIRIQAKNFNENTNEIVNYIRYMKNCTVRTSSSYSIDNSWVVYRNENGVVKNWHISDLVRGYGYDMPQEVFQSIIAKYKNSPSVISAMRYVISLSRSLRGDAPLSHSPVDEIVPSDDEYKDDDDEFGFVEL